MRNNFIRRLFFIKFSVVLPHMRPLLDINLPLSMPTFPVMGRPHRPTAGHHPQVIRLSCRGASYTTIAVTWSLHQTKSAPSAISLPVKTTGPRHFSALIMRARSATLVP